MGVATDGAKTEETSGRRPPAAELDAGSGAEEAGTTTAGADPVPAIELGAAELGAGELGAGSGVDAGTITSGKRPVDGTALDTTAGTTGRILAKTPEGAEEVAAAATEDGAAGVGVDATGIASGLVIGVDTGVTDDVGAPSPRPAATDCKGSAADDVAGVVPFVTI